MAVGIPVFLSLEGANASERIYLCQSSPDELAALVEAIKAFDVDELFGDRPVGTQVLAAGQFFVDRAKGTAGFEVFVS